MNFILSKVKQLLASLKTQELETAPAVKRTPVSPQQKDKSKQAEIVELRKRNIWSGKECALLIVALEDIYFGKKERADVIAKLSSKLRSMGRINGANVGDLYRNEAGIALQMLKMEFLLTEGKKVCLEQARLLNEYMNSIKPILMRSIKNLAWNQMAYSHLKKQST